MVPVTVYLQIMTQFLEGAAGGAAPVSSEAADISTWKARSFVENRVIIRIPVMSQGEMLQVQQRCRGHDTKPIVARIELCQG